MSEENFGTKLIVCNKLLTKLIKKDFWVKTPADQVMISMFMFKEEEEPIFVEKKLP